MIVGHIVGRKKEKGQMKPMDYREYNPDLFTRKSLRLPERDYTTKSAYSITLCADPREPVFEIPVIRQFLLETWQALPKRFPSVTLDEFVIMPDHIHFIIWLDGTQKDAPTLGQVIGAYKSIVAVRWLDHIKSNNMECSGRIWQRNFHERVVRIAELEGKREYIRSNPTKLQNKMLLA